MSRSSIFSFETLRRDGRDCARIAGVLLIALAVVAIAELAVRQDPHPKALPFSETQHGTMIDYLYRERPHFDFFFIGSSQCKCNVSPGDFETAWKQQTGREIKAFNGAIQGATAATWRYVYDCIGPD